MKADGHTGKDIAKYLGVSRATLYRYLNEEKRRLKRASRSACLASPARGGTDTSDNRYGRGVLGAVVVGDCWPGPIWPGPIWL
ncbi:MAG TPA: helix-turn-helix domain-containing protein [Mycobacterium sp.]